MGVMETNKEEKMEYWIYLEALRRSGITNMYGATPFLERRFSLSEKEAGDILVDWMKNYNREDYKGLDEELSEMAEDIYWRG